MYNIYFEIEFKHLHFYLEDVLCFCLDRIMLICWHNLPRRSDKHEKVKCYVKFLFVSCLREYAAHMELVWGGTKRSGKLNSIFIPQNLFVFSKWNVFWTTKLFSNGCYITHIQSVTCLTNIFITVTTTFGLFVCFNNLFINL